MKAVVRYVADDGSEWIDEAKATHRDVLHARVAEIMSGLGTRRDVRGHEYVQHAVSLVIATRVRVLKLAAEEFPQEETLRHEPASEVHPQSYVGRFLSEVGGPLNRAWFRFACIDEQGREWEQPYFVTHPPAEAQPKR